MLDLDKVILKYMLTDKGILAKCSDKYTIDDEYFTSHYKALYRVVVDYYKRYKNLITDQVILHTLEKNDAPADVMLGYQKVLTEIRDTQAQVSEFPFYLEQLQERFYDKELRKTIIGVEGDPSEPNVVSLLSDKKRPLEAHALLKTVILDIERRRNATSATKRTLDEDVENRRKDYLEAKANPTTAQGVMTGFREFDEVTNGLKGGQVLVVAGRPGKGKSVTLVTMAKNAWLNGKNVMFISLEMPYKQVALRFEAALSNIPYQRIEKGALTSEEEAILHRSQEQQLHAPNHIYIVDTVQCSALTVEADLEGIMVKFKPDIIFIDYIGIMKANVTASTDWLEQGKIIEEVREIARRYDIPITVAVQLTRPAKGSKGTAGTERLSRSDIIGQTMDIGLQIGDEDGGDEEDNLSDDMMFIMIKNRLGPCRNFTMFKNFERIQITDKPQEIFKEPGDDVAIPEASKPGIESLPNVLRSDLKDIVHDEPVEPGEEIITLEMKQLRALQADLKKKAGG